MIQIKVILSRAWFWKWERNDDVQSNTQAAGRERWEKTGDKGERAIPLQAFEL